MTLLSQRGTTPRKGAFVFSLSLSLSISHTLSDSACHVPGKYCTRESFVAYALLDPPLGSVLSRSIPLLQTSSWFGLVISLLTSSAPVRSGPVRSGPVILFLCRFRCFGSASFFLLFLRKTPVLLCFAFAFGWSPCPQGLLAVGQKGHDSRGREPGASPSEHRQDVSAPQQGSDRGAARRRGRRRRGRARRAEGGGGRRYPAGGAVLQGKYR